MKELPEDGSLEEITAPAPALNPDHVIIIQRSDELKEPGETTYTLATFDRTREGVEWPGDRFLEKLIPGLPKVKVPEVSKPEVTAKTNIQHRQNLRRKFKQRPVQRNNHFTTHRSKPFRKFPYNRKENSRNIDPWVHKPWENQAIFSGVNTATSFNTAPLISNVPFNDFCVQNPPLSHVFAPSTSNNNYIFPNNNERNMIPAVKSNIPFLNSHMENLNRPPPTANRMPCGPSFQSSDRFLNQHPDRGFSGPGTGPTQKMDFNNSNNKPGLLGEPPIARYNGKQGLLGDTPFFNKPFNRNLAMFPNGISTQPDPEGSTSLLPREQENKDGQNCFISNVKNSSMTKGSYDTGYGRISGHNFNQFNEGNEIPGQKSHGHNFNQFNESNEFPGQKSHGSYEYPQNTDDSRNNSFRDGSETNFSRFHNSSNSGNHYEDHYRNNYNHLDSKPQNNNKHKSLKNSRGSFRKNFGRFQKASTGVNHSKSGNDNLCENSYNESRLSNVSKTSSFMNNQVGNSVEEPLIHISDSAVVYNEEDFQNDGYSATSSNSTPRSNLNSESRSNIRKNIQTKNPLWTKRRWSANNKQNRVKYNRGQQKFRNWRTPQK